MPFGIVSAKAWGNRNFLIGLNLSSFTAMQGTVGFWRRMGCLLGMAWLLAIVPLRSEVVYTDIRPDYRSGGQMGRFALDIDKNKKPDFAFWLLLPVHSESVFLTTYGEHAVLGSRFSDLARPKWLDKGTLIQAESGKWITETASSVPVQHEKKATAGAGERYVGLRLAKKDGLHYGWARISLEGELGTYVIHDCAYETEAGKPIEAGDKGNPPIQAGRVDKVHLAVVETADQKLHLAFQFDPAKEEKTVAEYRLLLLENELSKRFDRKVAEQITTGNYLPINPGRNVYSGLYPTQVKTISGQTLEKGMSYQVAVLSVPPDSEGYTSMSMLSNPVYFGWPEDLFEEELAEETPEQLEGRPVPKRAPEETPKQLEGRPVPKRTPEGATETPKPNEPRKKYPKLRKGDYRLYSAGNKIIFKTNLTEVDPESTLTVLSYGQRLAGKRFETPETELVLENIPAGIYQVKVNINGLLISRDIYIR